MELLLNLTWLLLALPAVWLWRGSRTMAFRRQFSALQCLLALGCVLVILFPVISATDDLSAISSETEESPACRRTLRQAGHDKTSVWNWQSPPAFSATATSLIVSEARWEQLSPLAWSQPAAPAIERAGRAPPYSFPY